MNDDGITMERPTFDHPKRPDASWSDLELAAWIGRTKANPHDFPWRLQWLNDAEYTCLKRSTK